MSTKFYLDTSIWRDYFEDRKDSLRPLGEFAFQFLKNCARQKCDILYSVAVLFELKHQALLLESELPQEFKLVLKIVPVFDAQNKEALQISKQRRLPFNDVLHAIIARDNKAVLISRDAHFNALLDIVDSKAPEEVFFD